MSGSDEQGFGGVLGAAQYLGDLAHWQIVDISECERRPVVGAESGEDFTGEEHVEFAVPRVGRRVVEMGDRFEVAWHSGVRWSRICS